METKKMYLIKISCDDFDEIDESRNFIDTSIRRFIKYDCYLFGSRQLIVNGIHTFETTFLLKDVSNVVEIICDLLNLKKENSSIQDISLFRISEEMSI